MHRGASRLRGRQGGFGFACTRGKKVGVGAEPGSTRDHVLPRRGGAESWIKHKYWNLFGFDKWPLSQS